MLRPTMTFLALILAVICGSIQAFTNPYSAGDLLTYSYEAKNSACLQPHARTYLSGTVQLSVIQADDSSLSWVRRDSIKDLMSSSIKIDSSAGAWNWNAAFRKEIPVALSGTGDFVKDSFSLVNDSMNGWMESSADGSSTAKFSPDRGLVEQTYIISCLVDESMIMTGFRKGHAAGIESRGVHSVGSNWIRATDIDRIIAEVKRASPDAILSLRTLDGKSVPLSVANRAGFCGVLLVSSRSGIVVYRISPY